MTNEPVERPWYFSPLIIIIAGCLVAVINFGIRSCFGFFTQPVSATYGWPREIFSLALAIQNLMWGIATPAAGAMADRFGSARVIVAGALVYALGVIGMAYAGTPILFYMTAGVIIGIGIAMTSFGIVMATLGRVVPPSQRSWAFGIATASSSLGQFIFSPLAAALLTAYSWQTVLVILGILALMMVIFALPLFSLNTSQSKPVPGEADMTLRQAIVEAFGHQSYLLLVAGFFVCGFQLAFITVHLPPYLAQHGVSKELTGYAMGLIGLFNVGGAYLSGLIGGRREKRLPLSLIYGLRSLFIALFVMLPLTQLSTLAFTASLGLLWLSTVPLTMGLVTVMFGTRYMATLYGFVFLSHQIGSFFGVWLGGLVYDWYGNYQLVWWLSVALGLFAAAIHLPIREAKAPRFETV